MPPFSRESLAAAAQLLAALSFPAAQVLLDKHGFYPRDAADQRFILEELRTGTAEALTALFLELLGNDATRYDAPAKGVYDARKGNLISWLWHDGWQVLNGRLEAIGPAVEETTGLRDSLFEMLQGSGLDGDGEIARCLNDSAAAFMASDPDYNESSTKARIALETFARRAAIHFAASRNVGYVKDTWGNALALLRDQAVLANADETCLAMMYTYTSPGAHVPKGVEAAEWARLVRTLCLSGLYFLVRAVAAS